MTDAVIYPASNVAGLLPVVVTLVFGFFIPAAVFAFALMRVIDLRRQAAVADAAASGSSPLKPGPATLCGRVRLANGETVAVKVEVVQQGEEWVEKDRRRHRWTEIERHVTVRPFYVEDADHNTQILVEADEDVTVIDRMDQTVPVSSDQRIRMAELTPGEPIYAQGELVELGGELVLRPDEDGEMLLSSEPPYLRFDNAARIHGMFAVIAAVFTLIGLLATVPPLAQTLVGTQEVGVVVNKRVVESRRRKNRHRSKSYEVSVKVPSGHLITRSVSYSAYERVQAGTRVPVIGIAGLPGWEELGSAASSHVVLLAVVFVGPLGVGFLYVLGLSRIQPWWEAELIDEGPGPLVRPY